MVDKPDRYFLEMFAEGAEAAWDLAVESEAVKAVPVVGTAFKFLKGLDDLRSRALMRKLHRFLNEPSLRTAMEAKALRQEILNDPGRDQEIGEMLFLTLEKVTDMTKPVLLAHAYAAYINGDINGLSFEAIAHAIDVTFIRDMQQFLRKEVQTCDAGCKQRLSAVGLVQQKDQSWDSSGTWYETTSLGYLLKNAIVRSQTGQPPVTW